LNGEVLKVNKGGGGGLLRGKKGVGGKFALKKLTALRRGGERAT